MAQELLINVNVQGEEAIGSVDQKLNKVQETGKKTTNAFAQMRREMRDAKADMLSFAEGTKEYNDAMQRAAASADKMRDMQDKIKASQKDIGVVAKNVTGAISGMAGAFSTAQGVIGLFGAESDNVTKAILKVTQVLQVTSGIAQFADSLDSMKDLWNSVKINVLATAAAKQVETTASVENTVANTAEAAAITATGTAAKITAKSLALTVGPYLAITAAIGGIIIGITSLIKKMNEIPESTKIKIEMDKNAIGSTETLRTNILKWQTDYANANKNNNKIQLNELDKIAQKEYNISDARLKQIKSTRNGWDEFFKNYLKTAEDTYYNEAILKQKAEKSIEVSQTYNKAKTLIQEKFGSNVDVASVMKNIKSGDNGKYASFGVDKQILDLLNQNVAAQKAIKDLPALRNISGTLTKSGENTGTGTGGGNKPTEPYIKSDAELKKELAAEGINEQNAKRKEEIAFEIEHKGETNPATALSGGKIGNISTEVVESPEAKAARLNKEAILKEADEIAKGLDAILQKNSETTGALVEKSKFSMKGMLESAGVMLSGLSNATNSMVGFYQNRIEAVDDEASANDRAINNMNISEEERTKLLAENDKKRYEKQKELFEKQKAYQIASAWINFASGIVGLWSKSFGELGPIAGPIVAGVESAALLATTIAQTQAISAQKMDAPTASSATSSSSTSSAISSAIALNPLQSSMTTKEENLNMMNQASNNVNQTVVKVTDINKVQNTVSVRESNSSY